ncbi:late embryogenesis abundant protein 18 [Ziziphus jujuba]|uniref:Late embryogenesis abundant protein 18 n=2 Tax=Ziziphus jujuba TaxID=326968 RepID=A0ABM3I462_ZIZJJ|nr:late embryogenesis abundant protein 18 [Ziziphus jujuba]KAH7514393.1 hypothetical protein FEM48_Zijuj11G0085000 [Ziziphus jujuba var. spinosa]
MQSAKEKLSNMASSAKEHLNIFKAKAQEKGEKATASTEEEKKIAEEERKAKEAEAKRDLHEAKAGHAADKNFHTHRPHNDHHDPPLSGSTLPTYPLGGHRPGHKYP